jgi:hypothetical protein
MIVGQRGITTLSLVASRDDSFMRDFDVVSTHDARWGGVKGNAGLGLAAKRS